MNYKLEELIDIPLLQNLQDKLNLIYSFPSAVIDIEGKILTAVAWQDICTKFHRINPQCEKECVKSDQYIYDHLPDASPTVSYQCPHGLIDNATPIIINGMHLGNFFTGQFFLEKPDLEFFRKQAKKYGFNEKAYLEAVEKVPIWTKEKLYQYLDFIKGFIEIMAGIGFSRLKEIENSKINKENEERNRAIIQSTSDWIWEIDKDGKYCYCSDKVKQVLGYTVDEIIGKTPFDLMPQEESERIENIFQDILLKKKSIVDLENWNIHKDGHRVCLLTNGFPIFDETGEIKGYRGADKDITERKLAEKQILDSNQKWMATFNGMNDSVFLLDSTGIILQANQASFKLLNKREDEIIGRNCHAIVHKTDCFYEGCPFVKMNITKQRETMLLPVEDKWFEVTVDPLLDSEGNINGAVHIVSDITERKRIEEILKEKDFLLNIMGRTALIGGWEFDVKALKQIWTEEVFHIHEVSLDFDPNVNKGIGFYKSESRPIIENAVRRAIEFGESFDLKLEIVTKKGNHKWVHSIGKAHQENGKTLKVFGSIQDITSIKLNENILREGEMRFRSTFDQSPVGSVMVNFENRFIRCNKSFCDFLGYTEEELLGHKISDITHPDDLMIGMNELKQIIEGSLESVRLQKRYIRKEGTTVWGEVSIRLICDTHQKPLYFLPVIQDITLQKLAEQELIKAKEKAQESDRLKSAFLANMSHEIRTPMNGILGFAEVLKDPNLSSERQLEYVEIIEKSGARMLNIINDIIDISKIESGQMKVSVSLANVNEQIEFMYSFFKSEVEQKGLHIFMKNYLPSADAIIRTDREKLYAILTNLIKNAIKFTKAGSIEIGYILKNTKANKIVSETNLCANWAICWKPMGAR